MRYGLMESFQMHHNDTQYGVSSTDRIGLCSKAGELGLDERIHFLGFRDDINSIMREVDLLILPSMMEATPYVIVEAMAAGLPVVASGIFGIPELVEDGKSGILVPPGDVEALALAVKHLVRDSDRRKDMGAEGRRIF